ncbi:50S ribosomal protein L27 [Candidatus Vidania fulgoroideorum]
MAKKKAAGSLKNGRDSKSKRLGIKVFSGFVKSGQIIIRQRGTKIFNGKNTGLGRDHTIFSKKNGFVYFKKKNGRKTVFICNKYKYKNN